MYQYRRSKYSYNNNINLYIIRPFKRYRAQSSCSNLAKLLVKVEVLSHNLAYLLILADNLSQFWAKSIYMCHHGTSVNNTSESSKYVELTFGPITKSRLIFTKGIIFNIRIIFLFQIVPTTRKISEVGLLLSEISIYCC